MRPQPRFFLIWFLAAAVRNEFIANHGGSAAVGVDRSTERFHIGVGSRAAAVIDEVVSEGAVARSKADAPEIDGQVYIDGATHLKVGDFVKVEIEEADEYDLWGHLV